MSVVRFRGEKKTMATLKRGRTGFAVRHHSFQEHGLYSFLLQSSLAFCVVSPIETIAYFLSLNGICMRHASLLFTLVAVVPRRGADGREERGHTFGRGTVESRKKNASLRDTITQLDCRLEIVQSEKSDAAALFAQKLRIVEGEKNALQARLYSHILHRCTYKADTLSRRRENVEAENGRLLQRVSQHWMEAFVPRYNTEQIRECRECARKADRDHFASPVTIGKGTYSGLPPETLDNMTEEGETAAFGSSADDGSTPITAERDRFAVTPRTMTDDSATVARPGAEEHEAVNGHDTLPVPEIVTHEKSTTIPAGQDKFASAADDCDSQTLQAAFTVPHPVERTLIREPSDLTLQNRHGNGFYGMAVVSASVVNLESIFEPQMAYVALSRVRNLKGLRVVSDVSLDLLQERGRLGGGSDAVRVFMEKQFGAAKGAWTAGGNTE